MTSLDETRTAPVALAVDPARRTSLGWVVLDWARSVGTAGAQVVLTIAVLFGLLATVPVLFGQISTTVMSDSMEPGLHAGDVVVLRPVRSNHVKIGQVVLVEDPDVAGRLRLHRLLDVRHGDLVLKGDANPSPDSSFVSAQKLHGVGWLRVPWIGLPVLWMRDQQYLPLAGSVVALALLAWLAAADPRDDADEHRPTGRRRVLRGAAVRLRLRMRRLARSRAAQSTGVVLVLAGLLVAAPLALPGAAAAFSSVTSSPGNSLAAGSFDCPSRSALAVQPSTYYSYMTPPDATKTTDRTEPDLSASGSYPATLGSGVTRTSGNCSGNASPSVLLDGSANGFVAMKQLLMMPSDFTFSVWFKATGTPRGVLVGWGDSNTATGSTNADRQIYFNTSNALGLTMQKNGGSGVVCSVATPITQNAWHLAVATYSTTASTMTLYYYDGTGTVGTGTRNAAAGSTDSCSAAVQRTQSYNGYVRYGSDTAFAADASGSSFLGSMDESAGWSSALTDAQVKTIYGIGH